MEEEIIQLGKDAIDYVRCHPTDVVFLVLQNDRALLQRYLQVVSGHGKKHVNMRIGKLIKDEFEFNNESQREESPLSSLILSHQLFEENLGHEH